MSGFTKTIPVYSRSFQLLTRQIVSQNHGSKIFRSTVATPVTEDAFAAEWENAKPFTSIPGPKPLPIPYIGNVWRYMLGPYAKMDLLAQQMYLRENYGDIVRFVGLGRVPFVFLFDASYVEKMFRNETIWPHRRGLDTMDHYRLEHRKDFFQGMTGLLGSQNKEWQDFRSKVNQPMMQPRNVNNYTGPVDGIAVEFVERMRSLRDTNLEMPKDFSNELNKWALESIAIVALDARLGCLDGNLSPDSDTQTLIQSVHNMFDLSYELDVLPSPWKILPVKKHKKYIQVMDNITSITGKYVSAKVQKLQTEQNLNENRVPSILEIMLLKEEDPKVAITMALDMLMAGIDTTSITAGVMFYLLSKNPEKQEKLAEEIKRVLPNKNSPITPEVVNELKYLKACIKEGQRLNPIILGTARRSMKEMVIGNYRIPKGVDCVAGTGVMCRDEKYYPKPNEFVPERWLKSSIGSDISYKSAHPFVFLPFGFGPRSCVGKRFAELELEVLTARVIQNFRLSYNYGDMNWKTKILISFGKPLQFKVEDRK